MLLSCSMHTYYLLLSVVFRFIILIILFVSIVSIVITDTTLSVYIVLHGVHYVLLLIFLHVRNFI